MLHLIKNINLIVSVDSLERTGSERTAILGNLDSIKAETFDKRPF